MPPKSKLWKLDEHTLGKHIVLKNYLNAWLPIMGSSNQRILIIDGFAGPGEYEDGESGSPQIMLDSYVEHFYQKHITSETIYYFLERDPYRYQHLIQVLDVKYKSLLGTLKIHCGNGKFDDHVTTLLDDIESQNKMLAPCFAMIDPFGVSDTPMSLISRILKNPKSEIYISLMYEHINRFKKQPEFEPHLTELFGCQDWKRGIDIECKIERRRFFNELYKAQLKKSGAKQVVHFELYNGNRHVYTIFFATKHWKGSDKMKSAIWKAMPDGSFQFKGGQSETLFDLNKPDYSQLTRAIKLRFGKHWINIDSLLEFIGSDCTDFTSDGIKTKYLRPLESEGLIEVGNSPRKRKLTYPKGTFLRFV